MARSVVVKLGAPFSQATEESLGDRTALYRLAVTKEDGTPVALCHGMAYRKTERFIEES